RALAPAARLERDDRPLRGDRHDARHAKLGGRAHDRLHLAALRDRLDKRDPERRLAVGPRVPEAGLRAALPDPPPARGATTAALRRLARPNGAAASPSAPASPRTQRTRAHTRLRAAFGIAEATASGSSSTART